MFSCCRKKNPQKYYQITKSGQRTVEYIHDLNNISKDNCDRLIRVQKSEYQDLMKMYTGKKWTDESFPPNDKSLGSIDSLPKKYEWKRISQLLDKPQLIQGRIQPKDVTHGNLENCYFLSAVAALAQKQGHIARVFGNQKFNINGVYKAQLKVHGVVQQIIVDDYIPVYNKTKPLFFQPNKNQFWLLILEKAWAKVHGSYANITVGTPLEVLKALTYAPVTVKKVSETPLSVLQEHCSINSLIAITKDNRASYSLQTKNLLPNSLYTVIDIITLLNVKGEYIKVLLMRNPWQQNMKWNPNSQFWGQIEQSEEKQKILNLMKMRENSDMFILDNEEYQNCLASFYIIYGQNKPKYQYEEIAIDKKKKNGDIFSFQVEKKGVYTLELNQFHFKSKKWNEQEQEQEINRSTLLLAKGKQYNFMDGSLKNQQDNYLHCQLEPDTYYIFTKVDDLGDKCPDKLYISAYSEHYINIVHENKQNHSDFLQKMFMTHAKHNKRKQFGQKKMWISWKLFVKRGGFAYLAFGVEKGHNRKFIIGFDENDFIKSNYSLKKPYKGKGQQKIQINPGEQKIIVARVKSGPAKSMKFPPHLDIQIVGI